MTTTQGVLVVGGLALAGGGFYVLLRRYQAQHAASGTGSGPGSSSGAGSGTGSSSSCTEAYVGGMNGVANPSPGYSGFCRWPAAVQAAQQIGIGMVTRRCGWFWVSLGPWQTSWGDPTLPDPSGQTGTPSNWQQLGPGSGWAEYYGGTTGQAPILVRVYPPGYPVPGTHYTAPAGYWVGGYTCGT
jgi:hypothetical protein